MHLKISKKTNKILETVHFQDSKGEKIGSVCGLKRNSINSIGGKEKKIEKEDKIECIKYKSGDSFQISVLKHHGDSDASFVQLHCTKLFAATIFIVKYDWIIWGRVQWGLIYFS